MNSNQQSTSPFTLSDLPLLKQRVGSMVFGSEILGSQLGEFVLKAANAIGKKILLKDFGGLRLFAINHLSDIVTINGKYGNSTDFIYLINRRRNLDADDASASVQLATFSDRVPITDQKGDQFWKAFSNPNNRQMIEFDADKLLYICPRQISGSSVGLENFPSVNPQEYSEIISSFVKEQLQGDLQSQALALISQHPIDSLHSTWYRFLLEKCGSSASHSWGEFRVKRILELFEAKAQNLHFSAEQISQYSALLAKSQRKQRPFQESPKESLSTVKPDQPNQKSIESFRTIISNCDTTQVSLQSLAMNVVSRMSDEQIRQLALPVGYVLDAIKQSCHQ